MKKTLFLSLAFLFTALMTLEGVAQRRYPGRQLPPARQQMFEQQAGWQQGCLYLEGLTEDQQEAIAALRNVRLEKSLQYRARMDAMRARKRELMIQKSPDMGEVNKIIDQMEGLRSNHLKEAAAYRQQVRELLTDEQRLAFDRLGKHPRAGMERGQAARPGRFHRGRW
jgi:Spy/CpxP family protein refolding chaperone